MTVVPHAPLPLPPWLPASCDLTQAHFWRRGASCVHYNSQGSVPRDLGYVSCLSLPSLPRRPSWRTMGEPYFCRSDFYWVDQLSAGAEGAPTRYLFIYL
jgi:hypothetical protein